MRRVVFVQARMGSTRLPGKVLKEINGLTQIEQLYTRLQGGKEFNEVIILTSDLERDNALEDFCKSKNMPVYRGSEWDVLDRYYQAARALNLSADDIIVRATGDCPLHHFDVIDFAIRQYLDHHLDYFSNAFPPHYEDGCDSEVFSFRVLEKTWQDAKLLSQREHVTPFMKDSGHFLIGYKKYNPRFIHKLSVDTEADLMVIRSIFAELGQNPLFTIHEVVDLLERKPELMDPNKNSTINEGYFKSLREDKIVK